MKKSIALFLPAVLITAFVSCSDDASTEQQADSAANDTVPKTVELKTDSGKIIVSPDGNAVLFDQNGKIKGRGAFYSGKPSGAWLTYDQAGNIVSAMHYSSDGSPLKQLDKNDFEFIRWENKEIGASMLIPKNWKQLPSPNAALIASFTKEVNDDSVEIKPNINIVRAQLRPGDNLQLLAAKQMDILHQNFPRVDPPVSEEYFTVDSCQAFRRYGMYYTSNNAAGYLNAIIISGTDAWFISCDAQNKHDREFLLYQSVFHEILESFKRSR